MTALRTSSDVAPPRRRTSTGVVMTDVAAVAGVSQKTVSRVVNGSSQVRPEVRLRVQQAIDQLGYRPNGAARALVTSRTHVIGVVGLGSALYGVAQHVMGIERAARAAGYGVVVVSTEEGDGDEVTEGVERVLALGAEGVVLVEPLFDASRHLARYAGTPLVTATQAVGEEQRVATVDVDQEQGVDLAVDHLVALGHRRIGHLAGPSTWRSGLVREQAWRRALERHGLPVPAPVRGDWSPRSGYHGMRELLAGERPTAVLAGNDHMAVGAMRALAEAGLRVPQDVSLVGFDDVPEAEYLPVPLTTVRQDFALVAERSVASVVELVERGGDGSRRVSVPVTFHPRASTGPAPVGGGRSA
ncbi:LacI family DNA-binding transcriptional regulator [Pseudokineococcus basanitobsidens]|uniref:LacI family DNA-binding transcriptional regulator n=1 Tax=Pseudokineococcus basanitobsidens TaxID=1926649 RepID=A0ABU8RFE6_9ACTN